MSFRRMLAAILLLPAVALAQDGQIARPQSQLRVPPWTVGSTIRTKSTTAGLTEGKLVAFEQSALTLAVRGEHVRVQLTNVDSAWVRRRFIGRSALVGGVVSAVALSLLACQPSCRESGLVFPAVLLLPLPGVAVGAITGTRIVKWELRFP